MAVRPDDAESGQPPLPPQLPQQPAPCGLESLRLHCAARLTKKLNDPELRAEKAREAQEARAPPPSCRTASLRPPTASKAAQRSSSAAPASRRGSSGVLGQRPAAASRQHSVDAAARRSPHIGATAAGRSASVQRQRAVSQRGRVPSHSPSSLLPKGTAGIRKLSSTHPAPAAAGVFVTDAARAALRQSVSETACLASLRPPRLSRPPSASAERSKPSSAAAVQASSAPLCGASSLSTVSSARSTAAPTESSLSCFATAEDVAPLLDSPEATLRVEVDDVERAFVAACCLSPMQLSSDGGDGDQSRQAPEHRSVDTPPASRSGGGRVVDTPDSAGGETCVVFSPRQPTAAAKTTASRDQPLPSNTVQTFSIADATSPAPRLRQPQSWHRPGQANVAGGSSKQAETTKDSVARLERENEALRHSLEEAIGRLDRLEGEQRQFLSEGIFELVNVISIGSGGRVATPHSAVEELRSPHRGSPPHGLPRDAWGLPKSPALSAREPRSPLEQ
eukprot:TRINITY_DN6178_c1_g3_i1.p1 TRINITY_DN6178_c1_g3~~TRINITY_DN6178_c1_g3_i1.p1  ORF type:complete len:507 (+),score=97.89 TRINITY_DN6178_c1_g3_i1:73-1593(+)